MIPLLLLLLAETVKSEDLVFYYKDHVYNIYIDKHNNDSCIDEPYNVTKINKKSFNIFRILYSISFVIYYSKNN